MFSIIFPSLSESLVAFSIFISVYYIYWQLTTGASRRRLISQHGCKPIKNTSQLNSFPNNICGVKVLTENIRAIRQGNLLSTFKNRFLRNGNTIHVKLLFTDIYATIEPENAKAMLASSFKDWSLGDRRKRAFVPLLGHGIFTTDGAAWQHSRELIRPNFTRSQVGDLATFETHVKNMIQAIPRDGSTADLQDLFFQLTMDSATEFLFGESTSCLAPGQTSEQSTRFAEAFNHSQQAIGEVARSGKIAEWFRGKQFSEDVKYCHEFVDHFVHEGLQYRKSLDLSKGPPDIEEGERYVFLHELVKRMDDPISIRSELLNVLLAGRDTTASLLSDVWFILARRPDIWERLRKEVDALEGKAPTFQQLKDMKCLRWVLNESLRLYPVVPNNSRTSVVDTVLPRGGGPDGRSPLLIPKGQIVQYSVFTMHRRADFFGPDAEEFKPERWEHLRPGWEYLPFNGGPRICLGQQFAITEASYTTVRLMQAFSSVENRDEREWREWITLTCAIHQGTLVGLQPATSLGFDVGEEIGPVIIS